MTGTKTLHAIFDGKVLRPEVAVNLEPNLLYLVTIERKEEICEKSLLLDVLSELSGTVEGPEIGRKSMPIIYMAQPDVEMGKDNNMNRFTDALKTDEHCYWKRCEIKNNTIGRRRLTDRFMICTS